jgi:aminoglycoside/choline kinase family phosphotransferase
MIKTRDDINFPVYKENMSDIEKTEWRKQWDKIIKEYETLLRNYISQDFTTNEL